MNDAAALGQKLIDKLKEDNIDRASIAMLIAAGADLDRRCPETGETPALLAAMRGHADILKSLYDAGADINITDKYGASPLNMAAYYGCLETVAFLVSVDALLDTQDSLHCSAVMWAAHCGYADIARLLVDEGACLTFRDKLDNETAEDMARKAGHADIARMLHAASRNPRPKTRTQQFRDAIENGLPTAKALSGRRSLRIAKRPKP